MNHDEMLELINNYKNSVIEGQLHSVFFTEKTLRKILNAKGCDGIRFHLGMKKGKFQIIAEPTDTVGHGLVMKAATRGLMPENDATFQSFDSDCPDNCPPDN